MLLAMQLPSWFIQLKRKLYIIGTFVIIGLVWFLGVDWSWFVHDCPDCGNIKDVAQFRILAIPIYERTKESPTLAQRVAEDLGVRCQHQNSSNWHKHRWWGLLICKCPCINGIYGLSSDHSFYDRDESAKVRALAAQDKTIAEDFVQNVFVKHDYRFIHVVLFRAGVHPEPPENGEE